MTTLYTIGHSTRHLEELISALNAHGIKCLVDIRAFPMSRRLPQFNREALEEKLPRNGIEYLWLQALGGRRKRILSKEDSPHKALRNDSFRNYADYMLTLGFKSAIAELIAKAEQAPTAYMCAERLWFRCHRMMVSDWLTAHGYTVCHIDDEKATKPHVLMREARIVSGELVYDGATTAELFRGK